MSLEITKDRKTYFFIAVVTAAGITDMFYWLDIFSYPPETIFMAFLIYGLPIMFLYHALSEPNNILRADSSGLYYFSTKQDVEFIEWQVVDSLSSSFLDDGEDTGNFIIISLVDSVSPSKVRKPYYGAISDDGFILIGLDKSSDVNPILQRMLALSD